MGKTGRTNNKYSIEFKKQVVEAYFQGEGSLRALVRDYGLRNKNQIQSWIKKYQNGCNFEDLRGVNSGYGSSLFKGRPRTRFQTIEDERDYYKAQVEYLKKRYPNLDVEVKSQNNQDTKSLKK